MSRRLIARALLGAARWRRSVRGPLRPTWSLEHEAFTRVMHHYSKRSTWLPLAVQRRAVHALGRPPDDPRVEVERVVARGVPCAWIRPRDADRERVLVYLHGGGYSIGSIESHRHFITRIAARAGVVALAVDYRLAPEHPFPAQLDDARAVWRHVLEAGVDPRRVVLAGESAGGGLTMSTLLATRDAGEPLPAAAAVLSPWVDLTLEARAIDDNARYDYLHRAVLETYVRRVARDHDRRDPLLSPIYGDLAGLPPLLVQVGGAEALLDDARTLASRAREHGVEVTLSEYADMIHAFMLFPGLPATRDANAELVAFIDARTRAEAS